MKDEILKARLLDHCQKIVEATEDIMIDTEEKPEEDTPANDDQSLVSEAAAVMAAYQNANKWLDIIKENLLMDQGCVFFSNYVHNLAHTMPVRFDKFGDILHTIDMKVPYPATEYIEAEPGGIPESFIQIFSILDAICDSLTSFIDVAPRAVGIAAEDLLVDISGEYTNLKRMKRAYDSAQDVIKFDKWVAAYVNNLGNLID